ncbi:unnamed protein product [Closterium sp. NIES-54]
MESESRANGVDSRGYEAALAALSGLISPQKRADGRNWAHDFALMRSYVKVAATPPDCSSAPSFPFFSPHLFASFLSPSLPTGIHVRHGGEHAEGTRHPLSFPPLSHTSLSSQQGSTCAIAESMLKARGLTMGRHLCSFHLSPFRPSPPLNNPPLSQQGSTCAMAESTLRARGHTTGLFTSPHLVDVRERFRLNGEMVSVETFLQHFWWCYDRCKAAASSPSSSPIPMPAYFRFLTLLALRIFTHTQVDVAVLEVGVGGRYDGTNIVKCPAVCGVSSLGFDHMEVLGNTLALIADQKAGIFKAGVPAVTGPQEEEAMEVLRQRAAELQTPLEVAKPWYEVAPGVLVGLAGKHQEVNASLAVSLCRQWAIRSGREEEAQAVDQLSMQRTWEQLQQQQQPLHHATSAAAVAAGSGTASPSVDPPDAATSGARAVDSIPASFLVPHKLTRLVASPAQAAAQAAPQAAPQAAAAAQPAALQAAAQAAGRKESEDLSWLSIFQETMSLGPHSAVLPSLPAAIDLLRWTTGMHPDVHLQVLVTGSLHLVGDVSRELCE